MEQVLFAVLVVLGVGLVSVGVRRRPGWTWGLAAALLVLSGAGAWAWNARKDHVLNDLDFRTHALPRPGRPGGYVSSDRCEACHPGQYASWHQSYHRTMTQVVRPDTVRAPFKNVSLELDGKSYRLERRGAEYWAELEDPDWGIELRPGSDLASRAASTPPRVWRRIGLMTGSHHMQVFWTPSRFGNLQIVLPFAYLLADQRWVPLKDTFLKDPALPPSQNLWNVDCIKCHSTGGQPRPDPETRVLDTRAGELGIACEVCHGPGEAHVQANNDPLRRYGLHRAGRGDTNIVNPARLSPHAASQVCGQCHGIKWIPNSSDFAQNGFRYRPGEDLNATAPIVQPTRLAEQPWLTAPLERQPTYLSERYWPDGMVRVSGRDYNGLIEAPCYQRGKLSCLSCHSMHQSHPVNQLARDMESNSACLQCHTQFTAKLAEHTHHRADSSGSLCYNCHMPHTTYGLLKAIRNHYIDSPNVATNVRTGRPNACNLCHLDRSLAWTDRQLVDWYRAKPTNVPEEDRTVSAAVLWALRGDAGQRALAAWHMGWEPARRAAGEAWLAPHLAQLLADPYSAVRYIAGRSLRRLPGFGDFSYDFVGPEAERAAARQRALEQWRRREPPERRGADVLLGADGALDVQRVASLLHRRDDRSMDLQE
jgi:predicted CXXCH cytochrome family protein